MKKFNTSFLFKEEILTDCEGNNFVGQGEDMGASEEHLIEQVVEKMRKIISDRRLKHDVLTEHGFYIPYRFLDGVPPRETGWEDWCLIVCSFWDDDNMRDGPYRVRYLYVPKGSTIKTIPRHYQSEVQKIKVESKDFEFWNYDLDVCCPDGFLELPNFSYVWNNGKWTSKLRFGG